MVAQESLTDEEIVARILAGETALYEVLMRRYNQRVYRTVRGVITDDAEAEDVLQDAWVRAYSHLSQFRAEASFATWLTKIAYYEALARLRKSKRVAPLEDAEGGIMPEVESHGAAAETPEAQAMRAELGRILRAAVDGLPDGYRSVFVLREVESLSTAETAECLGLTEEAVKTRLHRSRALLRRELAGPAIAEAYSFMGIRCDRSVARVMARIRA
jgi:RNA polymerase sigma-70 factor (ECF subfamily)